MILFAIILVIAAVALFTIGYYHGKDVANREKNGI